MLVEKLNASNILERATKFAKNNIENTEESKEVIETVGRAINNIQIEIMREIVEKAYLKNGLTKRTVELSKKLDKLIVSEQTRRLENVC
jgi:hypothetical protein